MKKSRRTYNGVHLNKKSNTQDVVEQSLTLLEPVFFHYSWKRLIFAKQTDWSVYFANNFNRI